LWLWKSRNTPAANTSLELSGTVIVVATVTEDPFDDPILDSLPLRNVLLELLQKPPDCLVAELVEVEHTNLEGSGQKLKSSSWAIFRSINMRPDAVFFVLAGE